MQIEKRPKIHVEKIELVKLTKHLFLPKCTRKKKSEVHVAKIKVNKAFLDLTLIRFDLIEKDAA